MVEIGVGRINVDDLLACKGVMGNDFPKLLNRLATISSVDIILGTSPFYVVYNNDIRPGVFEMEDLLPFGLVRGSFIAPHNSYYSNVKKIQLMDCKPGNDDISEPDTLYIFPCVLQ